MKFKIKTKFVLILVIFWSAVLALTLVNADSNNNNVREGHLEINSPAENGSFFIALESSKSEINSPILRTDFPFNALFLSWNLQDGSQDQPAIYVRFLNEIWSDWQQIEIDDDIGGKDGTGEGLNSQMIPAKLTDTFQYKLIFNNQAEKNNLKNLNFTYLDTTRGPSGNVTMSSGSNDIFQIVARKNWGADETYRYDATGSDLWPEEYYSPKRFIIHHTAGEENGLNPMTSIRAIYYWHAKVKNWGDIGYNYIIDSKGNVYEGRFGGDGVVGGHAYMNNRSSIGIAILGCYETRNENKNSACNTPDHLTDAAKNALDKLIAEKSREFNIDPMGQSEYEGKMMPNILGHRDVVKTTCPGNLIYDLLPQVRQLSYNILQEIGGYKKPQPTSAELVKQSAKEINVEETRSAEVSVEFKNTGLETWRGYEDNYVYVTDEQIKNKMARIDSVKIAMESAEKDAVVVDSNNQIFRLTGGNVEPGQIGKFKLVLGSPAEQKTTKNFVLAWSDKGYFPNTDFTIALNKIPCTSCNQTVNSQSIFRVELTQTDFPEKIGTKEEIKGTIKFQNISNAALFTDKLQVLIQNGKESVYLASLEKGVIDPNSFVTFSFKGKASANIGDSIYTISVIYEGNEIYKFDKTTKIIAPYSAELTSSTIPSSMKLNTRKTVILTFKNTGTKTWKMPTLKSYDIDGTNSWFKDWSWLNSKTVKQTKTSVKPGEEINIKFVIQSYWKANTYPQVFQLLDGKTAITLNNAKDMRLETKVTKK
ncbi:MAG: peptidoglycan recognition family protein [Patescibacteria group bacterium]|nr:peptidoglycan recognition family protein [Patescibacteria group bacterium]